VAHTATQDGGGLRHRSDRAGNDERPITFDEKDTLDYHCSVHPSMVGRVHVK
jgi:plastocyanin